MEIKLDIKKIGSIEEQFLAEKLEAYVELICNHPEYFRDTHICCLGIKKEIIVKDVLE